MQASVAVSVLAAFVAVLALAASAQSTGKPCSSCSKRNITDDVRACRKENPVGCQHVYLYRVIGGPSNKVSCKYSLGGGQIYEMGALPRQLTEAEKQAVQKYHQEQKTRKCGVGKCPSMPCLCEDCPNRPKDVVDRDRRDAY
ncbi:hypothetical protein AAVH_12991 [Aphelenchoides avenae]|nr:hypothetical protein AAVH_12991 [Aphelenchus avenae]